jgi:hypothetical protein
VPVYVIQRLTDPRYRRPPYNRYPYRLQRQQRDGYLESLAKARGYYQVALQLAAGGEADDRKAIQSKLDSIAAMMAAIRKANVR